MLRNGSTLPRVGATRKEKLGGRHVINTHKFRARKEANVGAFPGRRLETMWKTKKKYAVMVVHTPAKIQTTYTPSNTG
jgi:hypothetical protein